VRIDDAQVRTETLALIAVVGIMTAYVVRARRRRVSPFRAWRWASRVASAVLALVGFCAYVSVTVGVAEHSPIQGVLWFLFLIVWVVIVPVGAVLQAKDGPARRRRRRY
jgi:peptidoglycan/LPS O-acetylase OafA/YrhL